MKTMDYFLWKLALLLSVSLVLWGVIFGSCLQSFVFDHGQMLIVLFSGVLFFFCITYSLINDLHLSRILPFILLAFPSTINNLFPGVYLESEQLKVILPYITHIDVYIFLILVFKLIKKGKIAIPTIGRGLCVAILLFIFTCVVNVCYRQFDPDLTLLLLAGLYPVRFLILLHILISNSSIVFKELIKGYLFSIIFLFIESTTYTLLKGGGLLESGSLGINTFGNIVGQIVVLLIAYYFYEKKVKKNVFFYWIIICLGLVIVVGTSTRMALLAMFLMIMLFIFPRLSVRKKIVLIVIGVIMSTFILVNVDQEKFDFLAILERISFNNAGDTITDVIQIEKSESTNSLITRLFLYQTSFEMFWNNLCTGIGFGLFNKEKSLYGFTESVIIDSHNGYLFFIAQLGLVGLLWIWYIYINPIRLYIKYGKEYRIIQYIAMINIGMAFCDLTNAGVFKSAVLSILIMNIVLLNCIIKRGVGCRSVED